MSYSIQPLVSVGIPTYNRGHTLEKAVLSILNQNYSNLEIIISDNASSDNTQELCEEMMRADTRIQYYRHTENKGPYPNFETCRDMARGKYFMWVASDDELAPDVLQAYVDFMEQNPDYVTVIGKINYWKGGQLAYCEEGLNLEHHNPRKRVFTYYAKVVQGALWYGLHRNAHIRRTPVKTNLAGDWHFVAANAFKGKIKNLDVVGYNKDYEGGASGGSGFPRVVKIIGLAKIWGHLPFIRITFETFYVIFSDFSAYRKLKFFPRFKLAVSSALAVFFHYYLFTYPKVIGGKLLRSLKIPTPSETRSRKQQYQNKEAVREQQSV